MFETEDLELWNLGPGVPVQAGAQRIFNVVGRLKNPDRISSFHYALNGGPPVPVFFNRSHKRTSRLERFGDFNIDTLAADDLQAQNQLKFILQNNGLTPQEVSIDFPRQAEAERRFNFYLDLDKIRHPQQVGQIIDGKWEVNPAAEGGRCLEIRPEEAGYDRIILFGDRHWTTGYEVTARLCVTAWTNPFHNVGLLFKWNPHLQGDGTHLPTQWSTGLGYYYSHSPGLRVRFGVDVHLDAKGEKIGDYVLAERPYSWIQYGLGGVMRRQGGKQRIVSQLSPGVHYRFHLTVRPEEYALAVWDQGRQRSRPQVRVKKPQDRLPQGSVGIIAYHCGVRLYEFAVAPLD